MAAIPKKVAERLVVGLKRYQSILAIAKARDVGKRILRALSVRPAQAVVAAAV